jgi:hypothetical protein
MSLFTPDWQREVCDECKFDPSAFAPADLAEEIERVGSRYKAPLSRGLPGEDLGELVRTRPQPDVWSALECACHVRDVLGVLELRTRQTLVEDHPTYTVWDHEAAVDDDHYNDQDPAAVLEDLSTRATAYATALRSVPADGWDRTGERVDGVVFTVAGLGRFALHEGSHHLLDVGRALRAARGR